MVTILSVNKLVSAADVEIMSLMSERRRQHPWSDIYFFAAHPFRSGLSAIRVSRAGPGVCDMRLCDGMPN
jgi:hypothetical protein